MNSTQATVDGAPAAIPWWTDLEAALAHADEARRPVYLDIWAPG